MKNLLNEYEIIIFYYYKAKNNNSVYPVIPDSFNHDQSIPPPPPPLYYALAPIQPSVTYVANDSPNNIYQAQGEDVQPTVIIQPQKWFPLSSNPVAIDW